MAVPLFASTLEPYHDRLAEALDRTVVLGLVTNLRFLRWLARQPAVRRGEARIDTLDRTWPPDDWADRAAILDEAWRTAGARLAERLDSAGDPWAGGWRLNASPVLRLATDDGDERRLVLGPGSGVSSEAVLDGDRVHVDVGGRSVAFRIALPPDEARSARVAAAHAQAGGTVELTAPMPGSVFAVHVTPGESVDAGDPVVTLEAMKMEHVVAAPRDGTIAEIDVALGQQVVRGQRLASFE